MPEALTHPAPAATHAILEAITRVRRLGDYQPATLQHDDSVRAVALLDEALEQVSRLNEKLGEATADADAYAGLLAAKEAEVVELLDEGLRLAQYSLRLEATNTALVQRIAAEEEKTAGALAALRAHDDETINAPQLAAGVH